MKENLFPNNIIQILGLLFLSVVFAAPFFILVDNGLFKSNGLIQTIFFILTCLIFICISYVVNHLRKQKNEWNFNIINVRFIYIMLVPLLIFQIGINSPLNDIINHLLSNKAELTNPISDLYTTLGALLLAPILEESIFRGIILKGLLTKYTPKFSIIISALIFGLIHGKPLQIWGALLLGLLFGWIYYKTKSLGTTILLHFFANLIALTNEYLFFNFIDSTSLLPIDLFILILSIPLLFLMTRQLILKMKNFKDEIK